MTLVCSKCSQRMQIDETKLSARTFKVKCPQCGEHVVGVKNATPAPSPPGSTESSERTRSEAAERTILDTFHEAKIIAASQSQERRALIWEADSIVQGRITDALKKLLYTAISVTSAQDAISKLERESFALIVVSGEKPETDQILARINGQKTDQRRETFLVVLSSTMKTMKANSSFLQNANLVISRSDLNQFEYLIAEGVREFASLYRIYNEVSDNL